jgi:hypothetical protein
VEDRHEAPRDHVVDLGLHVLEGLRLLDGRDDGEVVRDLGVVEDPLVGPEPLLLEDLVRVDGQVALEVEERLPTVGM